MKLLFSALIVALSAVHSASQPPIDPLLAGWFPKMVQAHKLRLLESEATETTTTESPTTTTTQAPTTTTTAKLEKLEIKNVTELIRDSGLSGDRIEELFCGPFNTTDRPSYSEYREWSIALRTSLGGKYRVMVARIGYTVQATIKREELLEDLGMDVGLLEGHSEIVLRLDVICPQLMGESSE